MKTAKTAISLLMLLFWSPALFADEGESLSEEPEILRPVFSAYMVQSGRANLADTYLSPLKYKGWNIALEYERMQAMKFDPEHWTMRLTAYVEGARGKNPAGNAQMWYGSLGVSWGMSRRMDISSWLNLPFGLSMPSGLVTTWGGSVSLDAGCLYNKRNSNNPASAKAAVTLNLTRSASWSGKIGRLPVTISNQSTLPVIGAFFSPDYGELYYEIYMGNRSGLAHFAWWKNYFRLENLISIDLHLSKTSLRIGYRNRLLSTKINSLVTKIRSNDVVLGVSGEWLGVSPHKKISPDAKIISAVY